MRVRALSLGLLLGVSAAQSQEISGVVENRILKPVAGAKVCLRGFADRCAFSDDSGRFALSIPAAIRLAPKREMRDGPIPKDYYDARGRSIGRRPGWLRFYGRAPGLEWFAPALLAKAAEYPAYYLETTKAGYRTAYDLVEPAPSIKYIRLEPEKDTGDIRSNILSSPMVSINRDQGYFEVKSTSIRCVGADRVEDIRTVKAEYILHQGHLYFSNGRDSCRATRLSGGGKDIVGSWTMDDANIEMPAPYRSSACPALLPFSEPADPRGKVIYRISATEFSIEFSGEFCLSNDRWFAANNLLGMDRTVGLIANSCRRTEWRNGKDEIAVQAFTPHGGRDSAEVRFTYKDKVCSYVDDGLFSDPPPSCPDPVEKAQETYLECVRNSGFAAVPAAKTAGPSPREARAKARKDAFRNLPSPGSLIH